MSRITLKRNAYPGPGLEGQLVTIVLTRDDGFARYGHPVAKVPLINSTDHDEIVANEERRYLRRDWEEVISEDE